MITWVRVVLNLSNSDFYFDNLGENHLQSQLKSVFQLMLFYKSGQLKLIGPFCHDNNGCRTSVNFVNSHNLVCTMPLDMQVHNHIHVM